MKRSAIETLLGAFVLAVAGFFLVFSYKTADVGAVNGYTVTADFAGIGGLKSGDDVTISGVKVGTVKSVDLLPDNFLARVYLTVDSGIRLPDDTAALISSESLLGGRYLALEPGAGEQVIPENGHIQYTQAPQNLEQLLGQFIFSMKDDPKEEKEKSADAAPALAPEPVLQTAPAAIPDEETPVSEPEAVAPVEAPAEPAHP
jgi:phospholipid/cholesterol/gamma-HCH transport system substrate-binding protein